MRRFCTFCHRRRTHNHTDAGAVLCSKCYTPEGLCAEGHRPARATAAKLGLKGMVPEAYGRDNFRTVAEQCGSPAPYRCDAVQGVTRCAVWNVLVTGPCEHVV